MATPNSIKSSVGEAAVNLPDDVGAVQKLLNLNRARVRGMRELSEDSAIGPKTIGAIRQFQTDVLHFRDVDGVVDPDGKTLKALIAGAKATPNQEAAGHANPVPAPCAGPTLKKPIYFPVKKKAPDYHPPEKGTRAEHHRYFGAPRKDKHGNFRAHAAVDLAFKPPVPVYAIADGESLYVEIGYFNITDAISFKHQNGLVVRYGEIKIDAKFRASKAVTVAAGDRIGEITANTAGTAMLHIEFFAGTMDGRLTVPGNLFQRRADLIDPTSYLDQALMLP